MSDPFLWNNQDSLIRPPSGAPPYVPVYQPPIYPQTNEGEYQMVTRFPVAVPIRPPMTYAQPIVARPIISNEGRYDEVGPSLDEDPGKGRGRVMEPPKYRPGIDPSSPYMRGGSIPANVDPYEGHSPYVQRPEKEKQELPTRPMVVKIIDKPPVDNLPPSPLPPFINPLKVPYPNHVPPEICGVEAEIEIKTDIDCAMYDIESTLNSLNELKTRFLQLPVQEIVNITLKTPGSRLFQGNSRDIDFYILMYGFVENLFSELVGGYLVNDLYQCMQLPPAPHWNNREWDKWYAHFNGSWIPQESKGIFANLLKFIMNQRMNVAASSKTPEKYRLLEEALKSHTADSHKRSLIAIGKNGLALKLAKNRDLLPNEAALKLGPKSKNWQAMADILGLNIKLHELNPEDAKLQTHIYAPKSGLVFNHTIEILFEMDMNRRYLLYRKEDVGRIASNIFTQKHFEKNKNSRTILEQMPKKFQMYLLEKNSNWEEITRTAEKELSDQKIIQGKEKENICKLLSGTLLVLQTSLDTIQQIIDTTHINPEKFDGELLQVVLEQVVAPLDSNQPFTMNFKDHLFNIKRMISDLQMPETKAKLQNLGRVEIPHMSGPPTNPFPFKKSTICEVCKVRKIYRLSSCHKNCENKLCKFCYVKNLNSRTTSAKLICPDCFSYISREEKGQLEAETKEKIKVAEEIPQPIMPPIQDPYPKPGNIPGYPGPQNPGTGQNPFPPGGYPQPGPPNPIYAAPRPSILPTFIPPTMIIRPQPGQIVYPPPQVQPPEPPIIQNPQPVLGYQENYRNCIFCNFSAAIQNFRQFDCEHFGCDGCIKKQMIFINSRPGMVMDDVTCKEDGRPIPSGILQDVDKQVFDELSSKIRQ